MKSKLFRKITETLDNLQGYMKLLEELKELKEFYYLDQQTINTIDNHIALAQELELEVNRVLSIAKDSSVTVNDMPDVINKLSTVNKIIDYRLNLFLQ